MIRAKSMDRLPARQGRSSVLLNSGVIANLLVAAVAGFFLLQCRCIPENQPAGELSVRVWPTMALLGLLALSLYNAAAAVISASREREIQDDQGMREGIWTDVDLKKLATAVVLVLVYPLMMETMGFALATVVFMAVFLWWGGYRDPVKASLVVVGGTLAMLYVFVKLVYVPLPRGIGFFETFTVGLYSLLQIW